MLTACVYDSGNVALSVLMTAASTLSAVVSCDSGFVDSFEGLSLMAFLFSPGFPSSS